LYFWSPALAFIALLLHAIVDGIDGPLARHLGIQSKAGSFTDTTCDQIVVVAVTLTMMCHADKLIPIPAGTIYIFLYTIVVVFAMVRNAMGIPYSWIVRPRLIVYGWLVLETFVFGGTRLENSTVFVIWIANILFLLRMVSGFFKIRANLK
jgi:phosphatidylglycerophosphate synthase